jgi:hypothetical protein
MAVEFEGGEQADAPPVFIHDGKAAQVLVVDQLDGVVNGGIGSHTSAVALHHIADPGEDVAQEDRGFHAKTGEDVINAGVGVAGAGGNDVGHAQELFEPRVSKRGTNGIHVRVLVADDNCLHGAMIAGCNQKIEQENGEKLS